MSDTNGRIRVQLTRQEIEVMRTLVVNKLREGTSRVMGETLGGIAMKMGRASRRIKTRGRQAHLKESLT